MLQISCMLTRRSFLVGTGGTLALGAAGLSTQGTIHPGCQTNAWAINPVDSSSLIAVLREIKELGFEGFETSFRNVEPQFTAPASARSQFDKTGLQFFGVHIFLGDQYDPETSLPPLALINKVVDGGAALGAQRVIVSGASVTSGGRVDVAALQRKTLAMNSAAAGCRKRKLGFCYHNHSAEFSAGAEEMEALVQQTTAGLVDFLIDAGHGYEAHADVAAFFAKHATRIAGIHLRDSLRGEEVPLGQGEVDYHPLAKAMAKVGWSSWVLAEEERLNGAKLGRAAVGPARNYIRQVFGV